ncbi:hypothetical protein ACEWPN_05300, partial [Yoonia sp. R2-816]
RSNRQHTFPIDTANPRGFHPERFFNAGHPYGQAETSRHGPHQKIFINSDLGLMMGEGRVRGKYRTCAVSA